MYDFKAWVRKRYFHEARLMISIKTGEFFLE